MRLYYPRAILEHGVLWLLLFIDVFVFTRLPIYMIDCIPIMIFTLIYGLFTVIIFIFKSEFSNDRIGYVYQVFDLKNSPIHVSITMAFVIIFIAPIVIVFILWNLIRLRHPINVEINNQREGFELDVIE